MKERVQKTITYQIKSSCGPLFISVGDKFFKCHFNKNGSCFSAMSDAVNHFVKFLIKKDVEGWQKEVAQILANIRCVSPFFDDGEQYHSCFDAISKVLLKHYQEYHKEHDEKK